MMAPLVRAETSQAINFISALIHAITIKVTNQNSSIFRLKFLEANPPLKNQLAGTIFNGTRARRSSDAAPINIS